MRIELLGPSGAGKSTILRAAQHLRADEPEWAGPLDADQILRDVPQGSRMALSRAAIDNTKRRAFIDNCFSVVEASSMLPSQRFTALRILQNSCYVSSVLEDVENATVIVHDELLLHRAFSLLLHSENVRREASIYFELAPAPDAAIIVVAPEDEMLTRILGREKLPNCYAGLDDSGLRRTIAAGVDVARVAAEVLCSRGVAVKVIETSHEVQGTAQELHSFCTHLREDERE